MFVIKLNTHNVWFIRNTKYEVQSTIYDIRYTKQNSEIRTVSVTSRDSIIYQNLSIGQDGHQL
jgi:hypothetical protein